MPISSIEINLTLDEINKKLVHYCLICGNKCDCNVCIECEAKAEARKVLYYCYDELKRIENYIKNADIREFKQKQIIETWNQKINYADLSCYNEAELKIIHDVFWVEIRSLLDNAIYYDLIFKPEQGKRTIQPQYMLESLRLENIHNMCLECKNYPCRYVKDKEMSLAIIKKCSTKERRVCD